MPPASVVNSAGLPGLSQGQLRRLIILVFAFVLRFLGVNRRYRHDESGTLPRLALRDDVPAVTEPASAKAGASIAPAS